MMLERVDSREFPGNQLHEAHRSQLPSSRSVLDQVNSYMARAKKTPLLSHDELISLSRSAYRERLSQTRILSRFLPCIRALVDQYSSHAGRGLKLSGLLEGIIDPSLSARDAVHAKNVSRVGNQAYDDTVTCPSRLAEHLDSLSGLFGAVSKNPAGARPEDLDAVSQAYMMCLLRPDELKRHHALFTQLTDRLRDFAQQFREIDPDTPIDKSVTSQLPPDFATSLRRLPRARQHAFINVASDAVDIVEGCGLLVSEILDMRERYDAHARERVGHINRIVEANLLLAASQALRPGLKDDRLFDRCQESNIGLVIAADRFKYWRNLAFSTYAVFWCQQRLKRYRDEHSNPAFSIPCSVAALNRKILKSHDRALSRADDHDSLPRAHDASERLNVSRSKLDRALLAFCPPQNIDDLEHDLADSDVEYQHTVLDPVAFHRVLSRALRTVSPRKRIIFEMLWGICKERVYDVEEVAAHFGMSSVDVRRSEKHVLERLAEGPFARKLLEFSTF